jgi:hypothetical protein
MSRPRYIPDNAQKGLISMKNVERKGLIGSRVFGFNIYIEVLSKAINRCPI